MTTRELSTIPRLPPVALCTTCGRSTRSIELTNLTHFCDGNSGKRRGTWGGLMNTTAWKECNQCKAIGYFADRRCNMCNGEGWELPRQRF